jgi:hypothetical protein
MVAYYKTNGKLPEMKMWMGGKKGEKGMMKGMMRGQKRSQTQSAQ